MGRGLKIQMLVLFASDGWTYALGHWLCLCMTFGIVCFAVEDLERFEYRHPRAPHVESSLEDPN